MLFRSCQYATGVWDKLGQLARIHFSAVSGMNGEIDERWEFFNSHCRGRCARKKELILCACWNIWKARNARIFRDEIIPPNVVAERVWMEFHMWCKFC